MNYEENKSKVDELANFICLIIHPSPDQIFGVSRIPITDIVGT